MNKLLHAIVYLILIVAVAALVFEKSLFDKRSLLGDRNRAMEDYIVRLARTIEKADAPRPMTVPEAKKDISPIADWRTAPEDLRPGKAATNTIYYAMLPADEGRMLLELNVAPGGSMSVRRLSAIADPVSLEPDAFQRLVAKTPYLIQAGGNIYFCSGKKPSVDKESFRSRLFSPVVAPEQKKGR